MTHGRIETTPEQQLVELRQAYARYATLADRLHDDDAIDARVREARERHARRIALAYEKTIAAAALRMESAHRTHVERAAFKARPVKGLSLMLAAAVVICGGSVLYLRPDIREKLLTFVAPVPPPAGPMAIPRESLPLIPSPRPVQAGDQPRQAGRPQSAAPIQPRPQREEKIEQKSGEPRADKGRREQSRDKTAPRAAIAQPSPAKQAGPAPSPVKPAEKTAAIPAPAPAAAPPAPVQASVQAPTPAQAPAQALVQTPAQAIVEPLSPPRDVAALPTPQAAIEIPETAAKVIEAPATQAAGSAVSAAVLAPSTQTSRLVPVMRTHLLPPYPLDAKRAGEQGTTQMEVSISTLGAITDCRVTGSSGSERLDTTACSFVKRYWRWQPPTRDGREVPATTKISVIWNLIAGR